jgi:hypothetical protein
MSNLRDRVASLSPERRDSLVQSQEKSAAETAERGIPRRTATGPVPLSFAQQRLWFLDQLQPGGSTYNITRIYRLTGPLDVAALERALNEIRRRHEVLRTNFDSVNGQPVQIIAPFESVMLPVEDLANLPEDRRESACQRTISAQSRLSFNLRTDRLLRANLMRLGTAEHVLVLVVHHCVSDGWSTQLLKREIATLYGAFSQGNPSPLPELPIQYGDYACWQRAWLQGKALADQLAYWKKHLGGDLPALDLPTDHARPSVQSFNGARLTMILPKALVESLTSLGQRQHASLFMTMLAAFMTLLHRYSGQEDIIVGTPLAVRTRLETEKLIGLFLNTLALRANLSGNPTFEELLKRVRDVTLDAFTHQELPFEKLVEELHPERSLSRTPIFQVMLNMFMLAEPEVPLPGLKIEDLTKPVVEAKYDLSLYARTENQSVRLDLVFNTDLFETGRMEEMLEQYQHLLKQIAETPDKPIRSYSLVTARSRQFLPDPTAVLPEPRFAPVTNEFLSWVAPAASL